MALIYKGVKRRNPSDQSAPYLWYPSLAKIGTTTEKDLSIKIADETTLNAKEADMAVSQMLKVIPTDLLDGKTVQLGDLGYFYLTVKTKKGAGADSEDKVSAEQIENVMLRFMPSKTFREKLNKAQYKNLKTIGKNR